MNMPLRWLTCLATFTIAFGVPTANAENKILFLGNSFTLGSGGAASVPDIFDALANAAGQDDPTTVMRAVGGQDYKYHYENSQSYISQQQWTHVIMQNYSTQPTHIGDVAKHQTYGTLLYNSIIANNLNTQVHLYQTWARSAIHFLITGESTATTFESTDEMLSELRTNYQDLADNLTAANTDKLPILVNPVGDAWKSAGGNLDPSDPDYLDLFADDEYHGNSLGYYLSACVHYAVIYQDNPMGLYNSPEIAALPLGISPADAAFAESIAWQTVVSAGLAEEVVDVKPPTWSGLSKSSAQTLELQFNEPLDQTTAEDPANYRIVNRGKYIAIQDIQLSSNGRNVTISLDEPVVGNVVMETSTGIQDLNGNHLETDTIQIIQAQPNPNQILIDFGGTSTVSGASDAWNQVALTTAIRSEVGNGDGTPHVMVSDLVDVSGASTGISLTMIDTMSGTNSSGTTSGPYPSGATSDTLYGHAGVWSGVTDNNRGVFLFTNLDPSIAYNVTFFASRMSASDNRETEYQLSGATSASTTLNPSNNTSATAQVLGLHPNASGEVTLTISRGANNDNADGFYYIGAVAIETDSPLNQPLMYQPASLGGNFIIDWSGNGQLYRSTDLSADSWEAVTPTPSPPFLELIPTVGAHFYRIEY